MNSYYFAENMGEDVSNCIDVTDFRFRCANKVQLFENWANLASPLQVVASASKYGLIFVGSPNALLVFKTSDLLDNGEQVGQECPRRIVPLEGIINLSVNCDDTLLMTVFVRGDMCQAFIFKVEAILTTQV
ncbi:hypothetical protein B566_EDAN009993 [Ephemera danica]|nr:hypothetical protein B566_EDAN009993 [Ephemera danica]